MSQNVFSLEAFYRTQPPEHIGPAKISSVLEYLAFSGAPLYIAPFDKSTRVVSSATVVDVLDDTFLIDAPELKTKISYPMKAALSFGYKRKRGFFECSVLGFEKDHFIVEKPKEMVLTNLRKNPRVPVDVELQKRDLKVNLKASTAVGPVEIKQAQVYEMSQLGLCLFVYRNDGLLLPGDKIDELEVSVEGNIVLKVCGVVSRVDMKRYSPSMPQSYQVVVLFRNLEIPKKEVVARSAKRTPVLGEKPCFFSAEHPLFPGRKLQGQVFEISTSGLSCMLEKTSFPIVAGMRFYKCSLQLPHKPPREFVFEVAHVEFHSDGTLNQFKLGGEFVKAPVELIKDVTTYAQEVSGEFIQDVSEEDLDLLWEFMFETNFIYQDKRRLLQSRSKEILETYHRLLSTDNPLVKKIIFKEKNEIKGHISSIRFYDRTWIIQHLNALKSSGVSAAQQVLTGITNFFYDSKAFHKADSFYVMSYYRPNNLYPAIVFGETCRRIKDPLKCTALDFAYGLYQGDENSRDRQTQIEIDRSDDMIELSDLLISNNMITFMRAAGLSQPADWKTNISAAFESLGLTRERHLLMAREEDEMAFAVVEMSSVGLNLSELTNSIFIFSKGSNNEVLSRLSNALIENAVELYFEPRGAVPVILQPVEATKASNVSWSKTYTCWILSAAAVPDFEEKSGTVLADFKELVAKFRNVAPESDPGSSQSARK